MWRFCHCSYISYNRSGWSRDSLLYINYILFNIIAVLIFPPLGHLLGFSDKAFGLWAGTAINDTSSVVAAGYAFSNKAGEYATIVKLTRATLIIPISLIFAFITAYKKKKEAKMKKGEVNYSFKKYSHGLYYGF